MLVEGYTPEQIAGLPMEWLDAWLLCDRPVILRIGSAEVLAEFRCRDGVLVIELAQIEGGGEGVLLTLRMLACAYAARKAAREICWIVIRSTVPGQTPGWFRSCCGRASALRTFPGWAVRTYLSERLTHGTEPTHYAPAFSS